MKDPVLESETIDQIIRERDQESIENSINIIILISLIILIGIFVYYLFCPESGSKLYDLGDAFESTINQVGLVVVVTIFSAAIGAPGRLSELFENSRIFRFAYFYLVIRLLVKQHSNKMFSHYYSFGATLVVLLIHDLLRVEGVRYKYFYFDFYGHHKTKTEKGLEHIN